jgi:hypothetical protein
MKRIRLFLLVSLLGTRCNWVQGPKSGAGGRSAECLSDLRRRMQSGISKRSCQAAALYAVMRMQSAGTRRPGVLGRRRN